MYFVMVIILFCSILTFVLNFSINLKDEEMTTFHLMCELLQNNFFKKYLKTVCGKKTTTENIDKTC